MKKILLILAIFLSVTAFSQQKALVKDNTIIKTGIPEKFIREDGTFFWGGYRDLPDSVHYEDGWRNVIVPQIDYATQKLGQRYYNKAMDAVTYVVVNKTEEELQAEKDAFIDMMDEDVNFQAVKRLLQIFAKPLLESEEIEPEVLSDLTTIYPQYRIGKSYETGEIFVKDSTLYRTLQPHVSQADWLPETTASLYSAYRVPGTIEPWVQPESTNPYMKGEKVTHNGKTWESTIDNNVWAPGVYGWKEV